MLCRKEVINKIVIFNEVPVHRNPDLLNNHGGRRLVLEIVSFGDKIGVNFVRNDNNFFYVLYTKKKKGEY